MNLTGSFDIFRRLNSLAMLSILVLTTASCTGDGEPATVVDAALDDSRLTTLVSALQVADLVETLQGSGTFTVFAPTNAAFAAAGVDLDAVSTEELTAVLLYHVVAGLQFSGDLAAGSVETLNGETIEIALDSGVTINGSATVIEADIDTGNGVVHVIDAVLLPPSPDIVDLALDTASLSTLVAAVQKAGLVDALKADGPLTVFAPTNDAFAALLDDLDVDSLDDLTAEELEPVLLNHVVEGAVLSTDLAAGWVPTLNSGIAVQVSLGDDVMIDDAIVSTADIEAANGVVHIVDSVILPPDMDIVEIAIDSSPEFTELVDALVTAGLDDDLKGDGPFTVFAPTNAAFAAVSGTTDGLSKEELAEVLLFHVVPGRIFSSDLVDGAVATLLDGESVSIDTNALTVEDADLQGSLLDIQGTNGVIHVIDAVMIP